MKKPLLISITLFFFLLFVYVPVTISGPSFEEKNISDVGWEVNYVGSVYDDFSNTTTFTYSVVTLDWEKDLSHWTLGMDVDQIPTSSETNTKYGIDPTTGVYGFKWDNGQDAGTLMYYTITLLGNIGEAGTEYSVKGGTYFAKGLTTGPGDDNVVVETDTYSISGLVYVDARIDSIYTISEPLISNVSVTLLDDNNEIIATSITDENGYYIFDNLINGVYTVVIDDSSTASNSFNDHLFQYFYVPMNSIAVIVDGADSSDLNFSAQLMVSSVLDDLNTNDPDGNGYSFVGTGKTIGFWKHQHKVAISGKGRSHVSAILLSNYLSQIELLWLNDPFQFADGNEYQSAFDIMSNRTSDANELLLKQLLGTEHNHVAGMGLSDALSLQAVILNWAEFISANHVDYSREDILQAKDLCDLINNSGE